MTHEQPLTAEAKTEAERLLSSTVGASWKIDGVERIGGGNRADVYRLHLNSSLPDGAMSAILKVVKSTAEQPYEPDRGSLPAWAFFNEWASLQCLDTFDELQGVAPRLYAGDRRAGIMLMEDLGEGIRLDHALLGSDAAGAEVLLLEYAATHGRLHAAMIGHADEYSQRRTALGPPQLEDASMVTLDRLEPTLTATCAALDIIPPTEAIAELGAVATTMRDPGPFLTLTQGDNCPDNCLLVDGRLRLMDFEGGQYTHALRDGVYGRMLFPTCWCVAALPAELPGRMEQVYRAELARGCPEALDDRLFAQAVCAACVFWVLDWCRALPLAQLLAQDLELPDSFERWQLAGGRQRIYTRMKIAAASAAELGAYEALGATFAAICAKLQTRWPDSDREMTLYPAFR